MSQKTVYDEYVQRGKVIERCEKRYQALIAKKRRALEAWLRRKQKVCKHKDEGGMFYFTCSACGLVGD